MNFLKAFKNIFTVKKVTNKITIDDKSSIAKNETVKINNCSISLTNSKLTLSDFSILENYTITLINAEVTIGEKSILDGENNNKPTIFINKGSLSIGNHSKIRASITIRFNGVCTIGDYNAINEGTEIRCDESLSIGSFNMISYNCYLLDTNSHNRLSITERRNLTIKEYPVIGSEYTKPPTKPVVIGSDCWFGKEATVLKGVTIGDAAVIGTKAVVTKDVQNNFMAYGNPAITTKID